jgi:hypothetical protein
MVRKIRLGQDDGEFDAAYWRQFSPEDRVHAVWEAVLAWAEMRGLDEAQLGLQRSALRLERR